MSDARFIAYCTNMPVLFMYTVYLYLSLVVKYQFLVVKSQFLFNIQPQTKSWKAESLNISISENYEMTLEHGGSKAWLRSYPKIACIAGRLFFQSYGTFIGSDPSRSSRTLKVRMWVGQ